MILKHFPLILSLLLSTFISTSVSSEGLGLNSLIPSPNSRTGELTSISGNTFTIKLNDTKTKYQVDEKTTFCMDGKEVPSLSNFDGIADRIISIETIEGSPLVEKVYNGAVGMRVFSAGSLKGNKLGPRCEQIKT